MLTFVRRLEWTRAFWLALLAFLLVGAVAHAQGLQVSWPRWDVEMDVQRDGSVLVRETQTINFANGQSRRGRQNILLGRVEDITDVTVSEPNRPYTRNASQEPYTYQVLRVRTDAGDPAMQIEWTYPPTSGQRTFILQYRLRGALRIYDQGDQLYWQVINGNRPGAVANSRIVVRLPQEANLADIQAEATIGRSERNQFNGRVLNGREIEYTAQNIPGNQEFETRTQFPHGLVTASPPSWQAELDRQEVLVQNVRPVVNFISLSLGLLIAIGGGLFVLINFLARGREARAARSVTPGLVREPPTDLPPAIVGTLLDERADEQDVVATLIDLANRGVLSIEETTNEKLIGSNRDYKFTLRQDIDRAALRPFESTLLKALFDQDSEFMLSNVKGAFYGSMSRWQGDLYQEVERGRLFSGNPDRIRRRYRGLGVGLTVLGGIGMCFALTLMLGVGELSFMPFLGLLFVGGLLLIVGPHMPKTTTEGFRQALQWTAFRNYLANIQQHENVDQARKVFNRYLPYAVALGIDQTWVRNFASTGTPAPPWFNTMGGGPFGFPGGPSRGPGPVIIMGGPPFGGYPQGPSHRRDDGGGDQGGGGQGSAGAPNMDDMSRSLADMLSRASDVFSHGGSGWSGGGGGWGGGGGGGGSSFE